MKFIVIVSILFQLSTSLMASGTFEKYLSMKKEAYNYYENKNSKEAYKVVKKFIKKYPSSVRAQNLLAVLYYWNGELSKSKSLLVKILKKENFSQASTLLKRIENKQGTSSVRVATKSIKKVKSKKRVSKKVIKQKKRVVKKEPKKENSQTSDVKFLLESIKRNPKDIISRKVLARYYKKIGKNSEAKKFASDALRLDPDDTEMLVLLGDSPMMKKTKVATFDNKPRTVKAIAKLNYFYKYKKYVKFINLYNSLENNSILMPTAVHVKALYSALNLEDYKRAKAILYIYRMPKNENINKVKKLIDRKLAQK
jgi:tetratricopeptide (TPR) repeat protein